jgi:hypothetical protein
MSSGFAGMWARQQIDFRVVGACVPACQSSFGPALSLFGQSLPSRRVGRLLRIGGFAIGNPFASEHQFPVPSSRILIGI